MRNLFVSIMMAIVIGFMFCVQASAADLFVDGANGRDTNAGTAAAPYQTVWKGWMAAKPGDTVHVLPTITYGNLWLSRNAGLPGKPITVKGQQTKVVGVAGKEGIMLDATSYVRVEGFDVVAKDAVTRAAHGIWAKSSHHVDIVGNRVKADCSGIQTTHADWITISKNTVYDSARRTLQQIWCSGISTHENLDSDTNVTDYKFVIADNVVYGTLNVAEPGCTKCTNSDGSGIIIDDSRRTQTDNRAFKGRHLLQNNVLYNNGGRGITSYISDNVDILNNTIHNNNQDPAEGAWKPGEITIEQGVNVRVLYNVLSSDGLIGKTTDQHVGIHVSNTTGKIEIARNLFWNPQGDASLMFYFKNNTGLVGVKDGNRFAPVAFRLPRIDGTADYRIKSTTNGYKGFAKIPDGHAKTDMAGRSRMRVKTISAGAYQ